MNQFIYDENELKKFFDLYVPDSLPNEVYFISLSARNKYLTPEEKEELGLGKTEMMERRIIREKNWNKFIRSIRKFETNERAITSKNGFCIPKKCMTI